MKKCFRSLALLLSLVLLLAASPAALAASPQMLVSNVMAGSGAGSQTPSVPTYSTAGPSAADIRATSNGDKVLYPDGKSYFSSYNTYYVKTSKGHSTYVFYADNPRAENPRFAYHGQRVVGIAAQKGMTCILYYTRDLEYRAGWIDSSELTSEFPGKTRSIDGAASRSGAAYYGDPILTWSNDSMVGHTEKYVLFDEKVDNCVAFTLDYQVTDRISVDASQCTGPRTVYINGGSGWEEVGTFAYNELETVHVDITLNAPTTIAAVAVTANCARPDATIARIAVLDLYTR